MLAGGALATYYYLNDNMTLALSFLIVGAFSPFLNAFGLTKLYFIGKQLFRESTLFGFWRRLIPVVALLIGIFFTRDPIVLVFVYFVSNTVSVGLLYLLVVRRYHLPRTDESEMISYSKHLSVMKIFGDVVAQADKVLIWNMLGAAPVAAYTLAELPIRHIRNIFNLLFTLTFPKMSSTSFSELKLILPHKARILLLVAALAVVAYVFVAPFLFSFLFPAYPESVLISQVLALVLLSTPRALYKQAFSAHQMKRELYLLNISGGVLRIIFLLLLVPMYGLWGAVYALLVVHVYINVVTRILFATAKMPDSPASEGGDSAST